MQTIGLPVILFVVFLILKLIGVITWSWLWVTSPLWISFLIGLIVIAGMFILGVAIFDK